MNHLSAVEPVVKPAGYDDAITRQARAHYRLMGQAELLADMDVLAWDADDDGVDADSAAVAAALRGPWLSAATAELHRRERLHQAGAPDPHDARYEAWADLAREVRERVDLVAACEVELLPLRRTGKDEHHGPCPLCGGRDRFMVRTDPPFHRFWCRQCGTAGDVIDFYRAVHPGTGFYEAVSFLATGLGLPVPDGSSANEGIPMPREEPSGGRLGVEYRRRRVMG